jgi:hypothetical protein
MQDPHSDFIRSLKAYRRICNLFNRRKHLSKVLLATKLLDLRLDEQVVEVDRLAQHSVHLLHLLLVINVAQLLLHLSRFVACEFDGWERELRNLHVVVNCLVEVAAFVGFHDHWEVIPVPSSIMSGLNTRLYL